jgi:predicted DCC family thiol-disulfide oxidoreductase YuxK
MECGMSADQSLEAFLPKLRAELVRAGMSEGQADFVCKSITVGAQQSQITTLAEYQEAWTVCEAAEKILTTLDDGSEAAAWCSALAQAILDFEDDHLKRHGYRPLSPATRDYDDGPQGTA